MSKILQITAGQKFGKWIAISPAQSQKKLKYWLCRCTCSNQTERNIPSKILTRGSSLSCGCSRQDKSQKLVSFHVDEKYGFLTITDIFPEKYRKQWRIKAKCDCGNEYIQLLGLLKMGIIDCCGRSCHAKLRRRYEEKFVGKRFSMLVVESINEITTYQQKNGKDRHKVGVICLCDCGKKIETFAASLLMTKKNCGCVGSSRRRDSSRKKDPLWMEQMTPKERKKISRTYCIDGLRLWTKKTYKKYHKRCALSGGIGKLCAHHIFNWADHPDLRLDPDNGICLIEPIHILFHKIYGSKFNNLIQLNLFKERYYNGEFNHLLKNENHPPTDNYQI